ncbi:MAG: DUF2490 domain-containing protein, partial [Bacteroidales bacterium]
MRKSFIIFIGILVSGSYLYSQDKDFGLWTGFQIEKDLGKRIEVDLEFANRLEDNLNQRDETFADADISYRIADWATGFGYRFTNNYDAERDYRLSHRYHWQVRYRPDWDRFSFDYRVRFQSQYFDIKTSEDGRIPENYIRNRLKVSYNIKKSDFEPAVSYEYFFHLNQMGPDRFERRRLTLSLEYEINKDN